MNFLEVIKSIILGIVEGITEWLPISSTGHMILVNELIRNTGFTASDLYLYVIQLGAILAVVTLYFRKLNPFSPSKTKSEKSDTWQMWLKVIIACLPAAVIGLLLDPIMENLENWEVVSATLIIYGIVFIIPGTSRSGSTILGAMIVGCSREIAAEFSFFLAIPVMFGVSLLKILKYGLVMSGGDAAVLLIGMAVAYIVSMLAIKFLVNFVKSHDFKPFGWYRIILGAVVIAYFLFF